MFRQLVDGHGQPMLLVAVEDGRIRHANPAACAFYGYELRRMRELGVDQLNTMHPATVRELRDQARREGLRLQARHRLASGDIRDVNITSTCVTIDGEPVLFTVIEDMSACKRMERDLRIRQEQLDLMLRTAVAGYLEVDFRTGTTVLSDGIRHLMGYGPHEEMPRATVEAIVHPHDAPGVRAARRQAILAGVPFERRFRLLHKDGHPVWVHGSGRPLHDPSGRIIGFVGTVRDVNMAVRLETDLRASESRYRMMFEASPLPMMVIDARGHQILEANRAASTLYGFFDQTLAGESVSTILDKGQAGGLRKLLGSRTPDNIRSRIMRHRCANGRRIDVECHATLLTAEGRRTFLILIHDLTERREAEEAIHRLVTRDMLTQLPNRDSLLKRLGADIARADRQKVIHALLAVNLDSFRAVNDAIGRDSGDEMLVEISRRLGQMVRVNDMLARIGGDEFMIVLDQSATGSVDAAAHAESAAWRVLEAIRQPVTVGGQTYKMTASIGVALFDGQTRSAEEALRHAETALMRAKEAGRDTVQLYDPSLQEMIDLRASLEMDLRRALDDDQFRLFYQIQVDQDGRPMGAEVLLRWYHPGRGMIPPLQFIDLAEVTGMIVPLGRWVLEQACRQLCRWARMPGYETLRLSVNVSARQFRQADFVDDVRRIVTGTGADPSRLVLELTESLLLDYADQAAERMHELRAFGIGFSLDDFGTGYSSLAYLKDLPLDELKIDRTFTNDILVDASDAVIVRTMIGMARNLGLLLIAEGVETAEQYDALVRWGCTGFQGYLFGRPVPIEQFALPGGDQEAVRARRVAALKAAHPAAAARVNVAGTAQDGDSSIAAPVTIGPITPPIV